MGLFLFLPCLYFIKNLYWLRTYGDVWVRDLENPIRKRCIALNVRQKMVGAYCACYFLYPDTFGREAMVIY